MIPFEARFGPEGGRGIALLFHELGTRRGWVVSSTPRPHFTTGKDPVPILQEAEWAPRPVWMGEKSRPHRDSNPGRPARSQSIIYYTEMKEGANLFRQGTKFHSPSTSKYAINWYNYIWSTLQITFSCWCDRPIEAPIPCLKYLWGWGRGIELNLWCIQSEEWVREQRQGECR